MTELLPFVIGGLAGGSVYAVAALGLVLTYKTTGIFNFAHGAVAATAAYVFFDLWQRAGVPWPVALVLVLGVLAPLMGILLERLSRLLTPIPTASKIVATIGLLVGIQGSLTLRYGSVALEFPPFLPTTLYQVGSINIRADQIITMVVALAAAGALAAYFTRTRTGRAMRAVVDSPDLLSLTGISPRRVQLTAWVIGSCFASLSGLLIAPTLGLDAVLLTLLVVQAFGAAAIGAFSSLPLTYAGGLVVGVGAALASKYVSGVPSLSGLPPSLPFLVLFLVLLVLPSRRLLQVAEANQPPVAAPRPRPAALTAAMLIAGVGALMLLPFVFSSRLPAFNSALPYVLIFASLALLVRTSGQVSLCHLGFAAVGASTFALASDAGLPWVVSLLLSGLVGVPVGALVAVPAFRLSRLYLALATFGFGILLQQLVYGTGVMFGVEGSRLVARPAFADSDVGYYFLSLTVVLSGMVLVHAVNRARLGRLLRAMSDSPVALATLGVDVNTARLLVLCLSAFLAALGGALLAGANTSVSSVNFSSFASLLLLPVLYLAGRNQVLAPVVAAFTLVVLPSFFSGDLFVSLQPLLFGAAAIAVAVQNDRPVSFAPLVAAGRRRQRHTVLGERRAAARELPVG